MKINPKGLLAVIVIIAFIGIIGKLMEQKTKVETLQETIELLETKLALQNKELERVKKNCRDLDEVYQDTERILKNCLDEVAKCIY